MKKITNRARDQLIREIVWSILEDKNFIIESGKAEKNNRYWHFSKTINNVIQTIELLDSYDLIDLRLFTNAYGRMGVSAKDFAPKDKYSGSRIGWPYKSKERFLEILIEMRNLLLDYGLQELEQLSIPSTHERPTPQSNQFLRENWKMIADRYYRELGFDTKSCREQFEIIQDMISYEQQKGFQESEPMLIDIAALYGDFLMRHYGGEWKWVERSSGFVLDHIGEDDENCYVLNEIIIEWRRRDRQKTFRDLQIRYGQPNK